MGADVGVVRGAVSGVVGATRRTVAATSWATKTTARTAGSRPGATVDQ